MRSTKDGFLTTILIGKIKTAFTIIRFWTFYSISIYRIGIV